MNAVSVFGVGVPWPSTASRVVPSTDSAVCRALYEPRNSTPAGTSRCVLTR